MSSFFGIKERGRERNYRPELRSHIICNVQPNRVNSVFVVVNVLFQVLIIIISLSDIYQPPPPQTALSLMLFH